MIKKGKGIRLSLFGFNKNEVDKHINNLEKQKITQLDELKESIAMITAENKMWERELEELKELLDNQLKQQEFMQYALNKAETEIKPLIIRTVEKKVDSVSVMKEMEEPGDNIIINDFNENSEVDVCKLENNVVSNLKVDNIISQEILLEDISENMPDKKELESSTLNIAASEEEYNFENVSDKFDSDSLYINILENQQDLKMFEKEKDSKNRECIDDIIKNVKGAEDEAINETSSALIEKDNSELNLLTISAEISDINNDEGKSLTNFKEEENDMKSSTNFWDEEFEELLEFGKNQELSEVKTFLEGKEIPEEKTIEQSIQDEDKSMDNIGFSFCNKKDDKVNEIKEYDDEDTNKDNIFLENKSVESKVVTREIKNIRSKYLVGKIVGEDLMDRQGNLLVKKGSTITENLIEIVDKEGKLAELILNMILPEISE